MKKLTTVQFITIALIVVYVIWEVFVRMWEAKENPSGASIRVDLLIIYPVLIVLIGISLYQYLKK